MASIPPLNCYSTALVLLPPPHIQSRINPLRSANDKSFPRWTSHITLVFPFVDPPALPTACALIRDALSQADLCPFRCRLDNVDMFKQRDRDTVYLGPSEATEVRRLWDVVSSAVGYSGRPFVPHLTLGQAPHGDHSLDFLRGKGGSLLEQAIEWDVYSVVILRKSDAEEGLMKIYQEIPLSSESLPPFPATVAGLAPATYRFGPEGWVPSIPKMCQPKTVTLATYNVLSDAEYPVDSRLPRLLSTILGIQPVPDVLCLQEVTDRMLRHLLADLGLRSRWPHCTHDPTSALPNENNIVFLSRETFGFSWEPVQLRKHKPAVVLKVPLQNAEPLVIAGIHLTAGLRPSHRVAKLEELNALIAFLNERFPAAPCIIMGDFNIPMSQQVPLSITEKYQDVWLTIHGVEDGGATYDPQSNILATNTVRHDNSPQRYDRIWIRHDAGMRVDAAELFGQEGDAGSDHYGLKVSLSLSHVDSEEASVAQAAKVSKDIVREFTETSGTDMELEQVVRQEGGFPTTSQQNDRASVTAMLRAVFSIPSRFTADNNPQPPEPDPSITPQPAVRLEFVPVGSFGLGVDTQGSDVDILVVGNISPSTFWSLARTLLRALAKSHSRNANQELAPDVILKRFVKDASVPMMELAVGNVRVDMQYCSASKLLECWDQIHALPPTDPLFLLPATSLRILNAYRDLHTVLRIVPSLTAFRLAHRSLKLFCISHGIYSSRLGYLGGIHLTLLLTRVALLSPPDSSAMRLVHEFFVMYADWDWAQYPVVIPGVNETSSYTRAAGREPMVILSIEKPLFNVVQNANQHTFKTVDSLIKSTRQVLAKAGVRWSDVCGSGGICGSVFKSNFLSAYRSFIKVDLLVWGSSSSKARVWIGYVESRLPHLLVLLQTSLPDCSVRLWPVRLTDANGSGRLATGLQSFYLLGFDASSESTEKIQGSLFTFEDQLRRDERFYDSAEMFVSVSNVASSQLPENIMTPPPWPDGGIDPDDEASDEEQLAELSDEGHDSDAAFTPVSSKMLKKSRPQQLKGNSTPHVPAAKLRTSSDVYHRILWDGDLDAEDYLIGYEDRFSGLMEMPLKSWKRDVEHEEFIPFHRVLQFRRKSDGVVVWDRRKKFDLIFGSGMQQQQSS